MRFQIKIEIKFEIKLLTYFPDIACAIEQTVQHRMIVGVDVLIAFEI